MNPKDLINKIYTQEKPKNAEIQFYLVFGCEVKNIWMSNKESQVEEHKTITLNAIDITASLTQETILSDTLLFDAKTFFTTFKEVAPESVAFELDFLHRLIRQEIQELDFRANVMSRITGSLAAFMKGNREEEQADEFIADEIRSCLGSKKISQEQFIKICQAVQQAVFENQEVDPTDIEAVEELRKYVEYKMIEASPDDIAIDVEINAEAIIDILNNFKQKKS